MIANNSLTEFSQLLKRTKRGSTFIDCARATAKVAPNGLHPSSHPVSKIELCKMKIPDSPQLAEAL